MEQVILTNTDRTGAGKMINEIVVALNSRVWSPEKNAIVIFLPYQESVLDERLY